MKNSYIFLLIVVFSYAVPPIKIPSELYNEYTMNGSISVSYYYFDNTYSLSDPIVYTRENIRDYMEKIYDRKTFYYGPTDTYLYQALDQYLEKIQGKQIGVIGSVTPLYESIVLAWEAFPTTIDYNRIVSEHPLVKTMTVDEYDENPIQFDVILSISSIEHDGLGRYGDPLNPNGDIQTMSKIKKMLKKEGILILAIPVGVDYIFWNAHRIYGELRLPLLLNGWKVIDSFGYDASHLNAKSNGWHQPVFVLQSI